jgi:hypothetical protein
VWDLAIWEENPKKALQLLEEAIAIAEQNMKRLSDPTKQRRYRTLWSDALTLKSKLHDLSHLSSSQALNDVIDSIDPTVYQRLTDAIGNGVEFSVPGRMTTEAHSPDKLLAIVINIIGPEDESDSSAPWLNSIQVMLYQDGQMGLGRKQAIGGLPIVLVNTATGTRHVQTLRVANDPHDDSLYSVAEFDNVSPGTHRLELFSPTQKVNREGGFVARTSRSA